MAASVSIMRFTGTSPGTTTDITGANTVANAQDVNETTVLSSSNPVRIPASGSNYSYWVTTKLWCTAAPAQKIDNVKWQTDGAINFGTGITAWGAQAQTYVQATGTVGTTGTALGTAVHTGLLNAPADIFTYNSTSPMTFTGTIGATTGAIANYVVYQLVVGSTASPGSTSQETFTWTYDET